MKRVRTVLLVFLISAAGTFAQQSTSPDKSQASQMAAIKHWANLQAAWGVAAVHPVAGSSLELVEKSRKKSADGFTVIHYNFKAIGMPRDASYLMEYWPVGGPPDHFEKIADGVRIDNDGNVVCLPKLQCGDKKRPEFPLEVAIPKTALGDTHRFLLTSEKQSNIWVAGLGIPFPIRSVSEGCELEIVRVTLRGEILLLTGSGFPANHDLTIAGDSAGERDTRVIHTDDHGRFQAIVLPFVLGKKFGVLEKKVTQGAECRPSISAKWGEGSYERQ